MPEIKHVFTAGKMNKDLDERFVPNGQYRDAMNIQVRTSDGGGSGTVQNVRGNSPVLDSLGRTTNPTIHTRCVGYVSYETRNKSYWLMSGPRIEGLGPDSWIIPVTSLHSWCDYILEYDADTDRYEVIVTDVYAVTTKASYITSPNVPKYSTITLVEGIAETLRPGCKVQAWDSSNNPLYNTLPEVIAIDLNGDDSIIHLDAQYEINVQTAEKWAFWWEPVLDLDADRYVTGINVLDDFLFFTDGISEPRKINIPRSKAGSGDWYFGTGGEHTLLMVPNAEGQLVSIDTLEPTTSKYLKKEHVTVIRPAPRTAPRLSMATTTRGNYVEGIIANPGVPFFVNGSPLDSNTIVYNVLIEPIGIELMAGDYLILENDTDPGNIKSVRVQILGAGDALGKWNLTVHSVPDNVLATDLVWSVTLEQKKPLFELDFGRFGYRYKYVDGEYSAFSPWSELAFLPGEYDYESEKGYNLGMVNNIRELKIRDFVADDESRPDDVDSVDILYKTTSSPTVYVVKTVKRDQDPEWNIQNDDNSKGEIHITSEMIHKVVPSTQLLRSWDAVPRRALAQEIVGNRLVYANYVQNYDVPRIALSQALSSSSVSPSEPGKKSIKSLRSYRVGIVFGDEFGRETPVQEAAVDSKYSPQLGSYDFLPADFTIDKKQSNTANRMIVQQSWENSQGASLVPPDWVKYCKYYIKETSSDYHSLVMDRWYEAHDGNVWISFFSSERNKIDEDTYLILKNYNGTNAVIHEEARYKVLDISNEVPNWVKKQGYVVGACNPMNGENESFVVPTDPDTGEPSSAQFTSYTSLSFSHDNWNASIGGMSDIQNEEKFARLKLASDDHRHRSAWVRVVNISSPNEGLPVTISLAEPLGPSADLLAVWNSNNYDEEGSWSVEFKAEKPLDLPEFDGRFFVKIYRDNILNENVLHYNEDEGTIWAPINGFDVRHLHIGDQYGGDWANDQSTNPAYSNATTPGPYTDYSVSETLDNIDDVWYLDELDWGADEEVNGHVTRMKFCGSRTETKDFWAAWGSNQGWFLDAVPFIAPLANPDFDDEPHWDYSSSGSAQKGRGLWNSESTDAGRDIMFFRNRSKETLLSQADLAFHNSIKTIGTYFKFRNDPEDRVFQVVATSATHTVYNYHVNCSNPPDSCGSSGWSSCYSCVFWVQFRRIENATALPVNEGCDVGIWDPRGEVRHTGQYKFGIDIVTPFRQGTNSIVPQLNSSVWETEPKESVDLDLYYEASNAIPMYLDENNIFDYAPMSSVVEKVKRDITDQDGETTQEDVTLYPTATIQSFEYDSIKFIETDSESPTWINGKPFGGFLIGDTISVIHHDGVETSLVIQDYVINDIDNPTPIPTPELTVDAIYSTGTQLTSANIDLAFNQQVSVWHSEGYSILVYGNNNLQTGTLIATTWNGQLAVTSGSSGGSIDITQQIFFADQWTTPDGVDLGTLTFRPVTGLYKVEPKVYDLPVKLSWFNCYTFGNGAESAVIRDDFNAPRIDNGVKVSTVLDDYGEEYRGSGLVYSGIYNSNSSTNELNEFNMSEKITKDLNPVYGSIQALKTRDTNVVAFCEDKVLKILAQKDALFNADGSPQLTATDRVLGQAIPFVGDYGISKNPESLASDQYRIYFADKQRGAVLRLSNDGLTPISNVGMKEWFRENLALANVVLGTFDVVNGDYNITLSADSTSAHQITPTTVTFNEESKGWISFKTFIPEAGGSVAGQYVTAHGTGAAHLGSNGAQLWKHYAGQYRGVFYNDISTAYSSSIEVLFNDRPSEIKTFLGLSYEGSKNNIPAYTQSNVTDAAGNTLNNLSDGEYYNLSSQLGWYCSEIETDLMEGSVMQFIEKEGKYFAHIKAGDYSEDNTLDTSTFNIQGIGEATAVSGDTTQTDFTLEINNG